jgi:2-dehydropantoate 2-reductase
MRQVPGAVTPIGIVGSGRLARHFSHYLQLLGIPVRTWSRGEPQTDPVDTLAGCRTVLILIRDDQIVPFIDAWPGLRDRRLVHCSGSLVADAAEGAHPLMTFGPDLYDLDVYRRMPFILEQGRTPFDELLPGLPNPWFAIPARDRPHYHALCVLAGNGSTLLWQKLFAELESRFGIPAAAAQPFLEQITANLVRDPANALTGPLSRGDLDTIAANLAALDGDPFQAVYRTLARTYEERS